MIGLRRLRNLRDCIEVVLAEDVPGDIIETGVWRGGACIYARAILAVHGVTDRDVWVADSFEGLPPPTSPHDIGLDLHLVPELAVSDRDVRANFERYGLLDDRVRFLKGWFKDTLPGPIRQVAVLRLDGDLYESTWDAIAALEPLVAVGGFVIVDDYGVVPACAKAIHDYRAAAGIDAPIVDIDGAGVYWRKA
jgi:Macrocin-O-methyltransferase (TylF)